MRNYGSGWWCLWISPKLLMEFLRTCFKSFRINHLQNFYFFIKQWVKLIFKNRLLTNNTFANVRICCFGNGASLLSRNVNPNNIRVSGNRTSFPKQLGEGIEQMQSIGQKNQGMRVGPLTRRKGFKRTVWDWGKQFPAQQHGYGKL